MKKIFVILFLFCSLILSGQTTYYIDADIGVDGPTHTGLADDPWLRLGYACTRATTPGDVIYVRVGIYYETGSSNLVEGVSIRGASQSGSIIRSNIVGTRNSSGLTNATLQLISASENTNGNQSISYLTLDGMSETASHGIFIKRRNNVKIHHCTIKDFYMVGIHFQGASTPYVEPGIYSTGNEIYNCNITNCGDSEGSWEGGGLIQIGGQDGHKIYNNILTHLSRAEGHNGNIINGGWYNKAFKYYNNKSYKPEKDAIGWNFHIEHWMCKGGFEIYDNEFWGGSCALDVGGDALGFNVANGYDYSWFIHDNLFDLGSKYPYADATDFQAICLEGPAMEDVIITRNYFKNHPRPINMVVTNFGVQEIWNRIWIHSNIFNDIGYANGDWSFGIGLKGSPSDALVSNIYIWNNTIVGGISGRTHHGLWTWFSGSLTNLEIKNNIALNATGAYYYNENRGGTINTVTLINNLAYNNGNSNNAIPGTIDGFSEAGTIKSDPSFTGEPPYYFYLNTGSPAIAAGVNVDCLLDYAGIPWNTIRAIGALEFAGAQPSTVPTVTTTAITDITASTATSGGNVTSDGGEAVTARGVCWSTGTNPTLSNNNAPDTPTVGGTGTYTSYLTNLEDGFTYYVRAYATNSVGTGYGSQKSFIASDLPPEPEGGILVKDGTQFVKIGTQLIKIE